MTRLKLISSLGGCAIALVATTAMAQTSPEAMWYSHKGGEVRTSKLIGTSVKNQAGDTIGDINEVILDKDGRVQALVVGVGGFLGIGEREVAVTYPAMKLTVDANNSTVATVNATKEQLRAAPEWRWATSTNGSGTVGKGTTKPN